MRKLQTKEEIARKKKLSSTFISIFFVILLVFSTAGYSFYQTGTDTTDPVNEKGFSKNGDYWIYNDGISQFVFRNELESIKNISVEMNVNLQTYTNGPVFLVGENEDFLNRMSVNLRPYSNRIQEACYGSCEKDLPEKTCQDNLIVFEESSENKVYQQEKCIFISGDSKSVDAFLYKLFNLT